jgi:hypothetical protein
MVRVAAARHDWQRRGLGGDPLAGVALVHATAGEAGELGLRVADDEPDLVAPRGVAGFHELDRLEDDGRGAAAVGGANGSRSR